MTVEAAAQALAGAHRSGTMLAGLPDIPSDLAAAYAVQTRVADLLGERVGGYKVGWDAAGGHVVRGAIFASRIHASPGTVAPDGLHYLGIEAEVAFRLGRPLGGVGPVTRDEVLASIESAHVAIELVDSRLAGFQAQPKLAQCADNQNNGALIVGGAIADWRARDLMRPNYAVRVDGVSVAPAQPNPGGDPLELLRRLAEAVPLAAGVIVTTGSCSGLVFARPGCLVEAILDGEVLAELSI